MTKTALVKLRLVIFCLFVLLVGISSAYAIKGNFIYLNATDDAYIAIDNNNLKSSNLNSINTGSSPVLKVIHSFEAGKNENIMTMPFLKFDLKEIDKDRVKSALVSLYALSVTNSDIPKDVALHLVYDSWDENSLTFEKSPLVYKNNFSSKQVTSAGWYDFDITEMVRNKAGSTLSFNLVLENMTKGNVQQVWFASSESKNSDLAPHISIFYGEKVSPDTEQDKSPNNIENKTSDNPVLSANTAGVAVGIAAGMIGIFLIYKRKSKK